MPAVQPYAWLRVFTEVLSDFAFVPALAPLAAQRRHFPLACAVVQLLATVMYNLCDAVGARNVFIDRGAWHQVSDVLTLTYVCALSPFPAALLQQRMRAWTLTPGAACT